MNVPYTRTKTVAICVVYIRVKKAGWGPVYTRVRNVYTTSAKAKKIDLYYIQKVEVSGKGNVRKKKWKENEKN